MPKKPPRVLVVVNVNGLSPGYAAKRRTVASPDGGDYVVELPSGQPVALIGDAEIDAFAKHLKGPTMRTLELTPDQAAGALTTWASKAAQAEIERLNAEVAALKSVTAESTGEPVAASAG